MTRDMLPFQPLNDRQGTLVTALLALGTFVLASAAIWMAIAFIAFGHIILIFFLAWLLAFILVADRPLLDGRGLPLSREWSW